MPPLAITEFTAALTELATRSGESAAALINRIGGLTPAEGRAFITDAYPALLDPFLAASGQLTTAWYAEQPAPDPKPGVGLFLPSPAPLPDPSQLAVSARWALTQNDPLTALRGNAIRNTMNASRDTVILNADREDVRWVRRAQPNACGFCKMLATRAGQSKWASAYTSRGLARDSSGNLRLNDDGQPYLVVSSRRRRNRKPTARKTGQTYHNHCKCTAVPLRDGSYDPPDYVEQWERDYRAARDDGARTVAQIAQAMDVTRVRPDRAAAKLAKGLPDLATEAARLTEVARTLPPPAPTPPAPADSLSVALNSPGDEIDRLTSDALAALESGDDNLADTLFERARQLELAAEAKAERAAKSAQRRAARREAVDREKSTRVGELIDQGWRPDEAEAEVYGRSLEFIRRRDFIARARAEGHTGAGFDELVTQMHANYAAEQYWKAEAATNYSVIRSSYNGKFNSQDLWKVNDATARKVMTEEMAAWFDANGGRVTRQIYRQSILDGSEVFDTVLQQDFLQ